MKHLIKDSTTVYLTSRGKGFARSHYWNVVAALEGFTQARVADGLDAPCAVVKASTVRHLERTWSLPLGKHDQRDIVEVRDWLVPGPRTLAIKNVHSETVGTLQAGQCLPDPIGGQVAGKDAMVLFELTLGRSRWRTYHRDVVGAVSLVTEKHGVEWLQSRKGNLAKIAGKDALPLDEVYPLIKSSRFHIILLDSEMENVGSLHRITCRSETNNYSWFPVSER